MAEGHVDEAASEDAPEFSAAAEAAGKALFMAKIDGATVATWKALAPVELPDGSFTADGQREWVEMAQIVLEAGS